MNISKSKFTKIFCKFTMIGVALCIGNLSYKSAQGQNAPQVNDAKNANQLKNASFENGAAGWQLPAGIASISDIARSGERSLQFSNSDPKIYKYVVQSFKANPGDVVQFSGWIKGQNVTSLSGDKGASLFVEATDKNGKWIWGSYPKTYSGTFDWSYVESSYKVPDNAAGFTLGLYMRKETTGTAWFDDIQVNVDRALPFKATLLYPNYRSVAPEKNASDWKALIQFHIPENRNALYLQNQITDKNGKVLFQDSTPVIPGNYEETIVYKNPRNLAPGEYQWNFELKGLDTQNLDTRKQRIPIRVASEMPKVYVDHEGFTVTDKERFFPLGVYLAGPWSTERQDLTRISQAGFNTILSYAYGDDWAKTPTASSPNEFLNNAQDNNLKVIYSLKDMYDGHADYPRDGKTGVRAVTESIHNHQDHPAILAWYINDELGPESKPRLQDMYDLVTTLDHNHPTYQALYQYGQIGEYFSTTDIWGTDPYPIGGSSRQTIDLVTRMMKSTMNAARGSKGVWEVLQAYDIGVYEGDKAKRTPTLDEMRNMSYQALVNGATGLIYYSYFDLWFADNTRKRDQEAFDKRWPDMQRLVAEIKPLTSVILKNKKVSLQKNAESAVQYQAWQDGNKLYIAVVSTETENATLKLNVPSTWKVAKQNIEGITWQQNLDNLTMSLSPQASGVIVLHK